MRAARSASLALLLGVLVAVGPAGAAVSDAPANPAAMSEVERAAILVEEGRYEAALPILRPLVRDAPGNADAWSLLGVALRKTGDVAAGLAAYDRALALDPLHKGANEYLGEHWVEQGEIGKARARLLVLEAACPQGCEERDELAAAIADADQAGAQR